MDKFKSGFKLKLFLVENEIKQRDLAKMTGLHYTILNQFLNGWRVLTESDLTKICNALDINIKSFKKGVIKKLPSEKEQQQEMFGE